MIEHLTRFYENDPDIVFIIDAVTDETIYMNRAACRMYDFDFDRGDYRGRTCHEIMHNQTDRCDSCPREDLHEGQFVEWEYFYQEKNVHLMLKDTLISDGGREYQVAIGSDYSRPWKKQNTLKKLMSVEDVVDEALGLAMSERDPDQSINRMIACICARLKADRMYIFEKTPDGRYSNTYEYCNEGVTPEKDNLQNLPYEGLLEYWMREFSQKRNVIIRDLEEYKQVSLSVYNVLKVQNIHSLVVGPLSVSNRQIGFFGVDNPPAESIDNLSALYDVVGHFLSALLRHRDNEHKIAESSYYDQLTGLNNRHALDHNLNKLDRSKSLNCVMVDLNGLKKINDTQGHAAGDRFITGASDVLKKYYGQIPVYRMGGDEFMVLESGLTEKEAAESEESLRSAFRNAGISAAVGSVWKKDGNVNADELMREADAKTYLNKRAFYGERRYHSEDTGTNGAHK